MHMPLWERVAMFSHDLRDSYTRDCATEGHSLYDLAPEIRAALSRQAASFDQPATDAVVNRFLALTTPETTEDIFASLPLDGYSLCAECHIDEPVAGHALCVACVSDRNIAARGIAS
jgi:hypothetical protein